MMEARKKKSTPKWIWIVSSTTAIAFLFGAFFLLRALLMDDSQQRQRRIQMVHLVKPPPPPKIKEPPPPPEVKKKEIIEPEPEPEPEETPEAQDDGPQDDQLGVDADGTAGSDGFGLKAKKGGAPLIGGGGSGLMSRYSWYVRMIQEEIHEHVKENLESNGGIPEGKLQTLVRLVLGRRGELMDFELVGSSGNESMDKAVQAALKKIRRFREPLPGDMLGAAIKVKISSKG